MEKFKKKSIEELKKEYKLAEEEQLRQQQLLSAELRKAETVSRLNLVVCTVMILLSFISIWLGKC